MKYLREGRTKTLVKDCQATCRPPAPPRPRPHRDEESPLIYVAGPYTAPTEEGVAANVRLAEKHGQRLLEAGYIPVIPHKITSFWDQWGLLTSWGHEDWISRFCFPLLDRCDGIYLVPGWAESKGAVLEVDRARERGIPVFFSIEAVRATL